MFYGYVESSGLQESEGECGESRLQVVDYWIKIQFSKLSHIFKLNQNLLGVGFWIIDSRKIILFYFRSAESGIHRRCCSLMKLPFIPSDKIIKVFLKLDLNMHYDSEFFSLMIIAK